jgi:RNA polymerase sigma-70 factor (ECF subfamily)
MDFQNLSDQELIVLFQNGQESALGTLVTRYKRRIFSYLYQKTNDRELSNDLFQDTFIKVINTLKKGTYKNEEKFLPWVTRIAHNVMIDYFRKSSLMPMSRGTEDFDVFRNVRREDSIEQKMMKSQTYDELILLIKRLPKEQKQVLVMRIYGDKSFKEIAEKMNVSLNTSLGRMRYALLNLRKMIEEKQLEIS